MTKEQRIAEIKARIKQLNAQHEREEVADAVLPVGNEDILDEMGVMDTYREHCRDNRNTLNSDE